MLGGLTKETLKSEKSTLEPRELFLVVDDSPAGNNYDQKTGLADVSLVLVPGTSYLPQHRNEDSLLTASAASNTSATETDAIVYYPHLIHPNHPLLPLRISSLISSLVSVSRTSLRIASLSSDALFDSLKFSTAASLCLGRRALVTAISSARTLHTITSRRLDTSSSDEGSFIHILDGYTNNGIDLVNHTFSLVELLSLSSFHLASSTIKYSLEIAEESAQLIDSLFGETDTSKALAALIQIYVAEYSRQDDESGLNKRFGDMYTVGQLAKSLAAYCCLQYVTRKQWRSLIKLKPIFVGYVSKDAVGYDPSHQKMYFEMFKSNNSVSSLGASDGNSIVPSNLNKSSDPSSLSLQDNSTRCTSTADIDTNLHVDVAYVREIVQNSSPNPKNRHVKPMESVFSSSNTTSYGLRQTISPPLDEPDFALLNKWRRTSKGHIEMACRYIKFAVGAYGTSFLRIMGLGKARDHSVDAHGYHHNHQSLAFYTNIPVDNIIASSYLSTETPHPPKVIAPVHYVVVDKDSKSVIVCLRGTLGISDVVTDLTASYSQYCLNGQQGYVHLGILQSAQKIARSPIKDAVVESLKKHPGYGLVLTGHSLGGGCAALLAMLWSTLTTSQNGQEYYTTKESEGFPLRPIHCYVFGCPAIMSSSLSKQLRSLITCFIFRHDVFPSLSLGLLRDFQNVTVNLCNEEGMAERVIGNVLGLFRGNNAGNVCNESEELWYWALLKTLRADMRTDKLYPPGQVLWINAKSGDTPIHQQNLSAIPMSIHEVEDVEIAFSEFTFSRTMFTDHAPYHYEGSLDALRSALQHDVKIDL